MLNRETIFRDVLIYIMVFFSAILSLFLVQVLMFSEDDAVILFHGFNFLCYFTPLFGAIIADSFLGKFKTIMYLATIYAIGEIILTIGAIGGTENGNQGIEGLPARYVQKLIYIKCTLPLML